MTGVFIAAAKTDKKMWKTFPAILCANLDAIYLRDSADWETVAGAEIVVCDISLHDAIRPDNTIIIWKEDVDIPGLLVADNRTVAVVNADGDPQALVPLSGTLLPAVTCGMSARDTLTLSSYGAENAVITLQRSLSCFDGRSTEPQEIPIAQSDGIDSFTLMAASAVFLLTGNRKQLDSADFSAGGYK